VSDQAAAASAVAKVFRLACEIDRARAKSGRGGRLEFVDVGGGAAVDYEGATEPGLEEYVSILRSKAPALDERQLITEYGRFTQTHGGWLVSDVEYVHRRSGHDVAVIHHGADMFVREVYSSAAPRHRVLALDRAGRARRGRLRPCRLAGPLCFAGDFLGGTYRLPQLREGDRVIVTDVGSNTFALWSKHCSRVFPKVIGYSRRRRELRVIKERESPEAAAACWA
jgi:diaminopimelate decarboxylase